MNILIFGKNGQVGSKLASVFLNQGGSEEAQINFLGRDECDVTKKDQIKKAFHQYRPNFLINATAYTAVDQAEKDVERAYQINSEAVLEMAKMAYENNIWLIHYSTDYVFKGDKMSPYNENDETCPTGVYGASKLQGEKNIIETHDKYIILRTSWVYGEHGNNFPKTILKLARDRKELKIVHDQVGVPTHASFIAHTTFDIVQRLAKTDNDKLSAIYHLSSEGRCSWYEFAKFFIEYADGHGLPLKCNPKNMVPIHFLDYPTVAQRPAYSVLDPTKLIQIFHVKTYDWREDARMFIQNYIHGNIS